MATKKAQQFLKFFSRYKAEIVLVLLIAETVILVSGPKKRNPLLETAFTVEPGKNYSLLIDDERFPVKTHPGEEIVVRVFPGEKSGFHFPSKRVVILQQTEQNRMSTVRKSRFKFYYNRPEELESLYEREHLAALRGKTDWQTIENVLTRIARELNAGLPLIYPSQNALSVLDLFRKNKEEIFCAQYCYITVQFLQALGYFARYITIYDHEICEVWVPQYHKWVCLDPTNDVYYVDAKGTKLSALEIAKIPQAALPISRTDVSKKRLSALYTRLWFWLTNDLATHPVNIYDLNKYRVRAIFREDQLNDLDPADLYTVYPEELYQPPTY